MLARVLLSTEMWFALQLKRAISPPYLECLLVPSKMHAEGLPLLGMPNAPLFKRVFLPLSPVCPHARFKIPAERQPSRAMPSAQLRKDAIWQRLKGRHHALTKMLVGGPVSPVIQVAVLFKLVWRQQL